MFDQNLPDSAMPALLVIDPSADDRSRICDSLAELEDLRIVSADDGERALEIIRETWPTMILLDTTLNGIDGISLTRTIREMEKLREPTGLSPWTPIVFLSSMADDELLAEGIQAGGDDFLCKPVPEVVLRSKVRAMLQAATRQQDVRQVHQQLKDCAILDALTGIPNRRYFDDTLAIEWKRCLRVEMPLSIVIAEIDGFRQFNDTYGNLAGDNCLKTIAGVLTESLFRIEDTVARYDESKFVAILPGTDAEGAHAVAERMNNTIRNLSIPHDHGIEGRVSCRFFVACSLPHPGQGLQQLLHMADAALNRSRNTAADCVALKLV